VVALVELLVKRLAAAAGEGAARGTPASTVLPGWVELCPALRALAALHEALAEMSQVDAARLPLNGQVGPQPALGSTEGNSSQLALLNRSLSLLGRDLGECAAPFACGVALWCCAVVG
jgi:hypothetical protein